MNVRTYTHTHTHDIISKTRQEWLYFLGDPKETHSECQHKVKREVYDRWGDARRQTVLCGGGEREEDSWEGQE